MRLRRSSVPGGSQACVKRPTSDVETMRFTFVYGPDTPFLQLKYHEPSPLRYGNFPGHIELPGYNIIYRMNAYGGMYTEMRCNRCHCLWQSSHMCASSDQPAEHQT